MFNIIKTKRNKTPTAPTYMTKKDTGKNSKLNRNKIQETLKKEKIKNKTEKIKIFVMKKFNRIFRKLNLRP